MKKRKKVEIGEVKIDLTPLIDCVFLLIVFFIVAGKFKKVESKLDAYLPKDIGIDSRAIPDPDRFFIQVICWGNRDKIEWKVNNFTVETKSELVKKLREISATIDEEGGGNKKNIKVAIDGNADINFYWVIAALDACAEAQLTEIILTPPRVPLNQWPRPRPKNIPLPTE